MNEMLKNLKAFANSCIAYKGYNYFWIHWAFKKRIRQFENE